jgi:hypothetical protein
VCRRTLRAELGIGSGIRGPFRAGLLIGVGVAGAGAAIAVATVPGPDGVIHACYEVQTIGSAVAPVTGAANIRIIDPGAGQSCTTAVPGPPSAERALDWNKAGPSGVAGTTGVPGAHGQTGAPGVPATYTFASPPPGRTFGEALFGSGSSAPELDVFGIGSPAGTVRIRALPATLSSGRLSVGLENVTAGDVEAWSRGLRYQTAVVSIPLENNGGPPAYLRFDFKLVAVKTSQWSGGSEAPQEPVTLDHNALAIGYTQQDPIPRHRS